MGKRLGIVVAVFLAGLGLGRFEAPTKVVTKTQVVHDVKLVDHSHITRTTKVTPEGARVTTVTIEKDVRGEDEHSSESSRVVTRDNPKWLVSGLMAVSPQGSGFGARIEYRVLGPFFVGAEGMALPGGALGAASLGIQF